MTTCKERLARENKSFEPVEQSSKEAGGELGLAG